MTCSERIGTFILAILATLQALQGMLNIGEPWPPNPRD